MKAEIIAVGSELLTPDRQDTNSLFLTAQLNRLGIEVVRKTIVGDDAEILGRAFRAAMEGADVVIASGGVGATVLPNPRGTAPGLWVEDGKRLVILLPGPPAELEPMFAEQVAPRLEPRSAGPRLYTRDLRTTGLGESAVDQAIAPIYKGYRDIQTTLLHVPGEIQIHLRLWSEETAAAVRRLDEVVERIARALGDILFTTNGEDMEEVVARELTWHGATIAVAESCTGGMLGERLTRLAGSSSHFAGGVISYSNDLKSALLDVPK